MILLRQTPLIRWAVLSAAALLAPLGALRAELAASSPFLPAGAAASAGAAAAAADPIELRGIMALPDGFAYCIYDAAKKTSSWVGLNETGNEFVVKSADPANESVMVTLQGRDIHLSLKESKVVSTGAGSAGTPVAPTAPETLGPLRKGQGQGDEQKRLDAVANEVRRRRQEREKAAQNGTPGIPGAPLPPAPANPNR